MNHTTETLINAAQSFDSHPCTLHSGYMSDSAMRVIGESVARIDTLDHDDADSINALLNVRNLALDLLTISDVFTFEMEQGKILLDEACYKREALEEYYSDGMKELHS